LPYVVNFELPNVPGDYVHRIGRTARAGREGHAVSLVCIDERQLLADIERLIKRKIDQHIVPGFEPDPRIKAEPIQNGRSQQARRRHSQPHHRSGAGPGKSRAGSRNRHSKPRQRAGS
jgi:ATP-dependent RNA helicase RhlE